MQITFISSLDTGELLTMYSKSDNAKIKMGFETNDIINELFKSSLKKYQEGLETKMRGRDFVFEDVDLLCYGLHKISLKRGKSYIVSPSWIKNKNATINPRNKDNECFKCPVTIALNHKKIVNHSERISFKLKTYVDQYSWKDIEFPSSSKDCKKFEQNNKTIALNILHVPYNTEKIEQAYISKYNNKRENQVISLMIINDDINWHYLTVKKSPALLRGITSNNNGEFYCLNCFHSYSTKSALKKHERICENHGYCYVEMPKKDKKILE